MDSTALSPFTEWITGIPSGIVTATAQIHSLMPDSLLFGALVLFFLTHNLSFGVFAIFVFEVVLSHRFIGWIMAQSTGSSRSGTDDVACRQGFKTAQMAAARIFQHEPYPSYGVFSMAAMATYLGLATQEYAPIRKAMGAQWDSRGTAAVVCIGLLLFAFIMSRLYLSNCGDTAGEVMIALFTAAITGLLWFTVNKRIFGEEAMNFLGLPYLVSKNNKGDSIYVCAKDASTQ
jgi:hypothetical protein